ncbi:MAG TPA: hypothetical protein VK750_07660, partial [Cytophagaceae bacterium]|nr:hypothetical protein [Cytophagaceae bacterium]
MKKLLLCGSALLFSLGVANAQVGYQTKGGHDDFATTNEYVDAVSGKGLYWYDNTGATTIKLTRTGGGAGMDINVTNAGGCRSGSNCYPSFGLNFGSGVTMDLSQQADMTFDIANQVNAFTWITVILTDANGKTASYEPNVSDVLPTTTWSDPSQPRKALNGFTYTTNNRVT